MGDLLKNVGASLGVNAGKAVVGSPAGECETPARAIDPGAANHSKRAESQQEASLRKADVLRQAGFQAPLARDTQSPRYAKTEYYSPTRESAFFQKVETLYPSAEFTGISGTATLPQVQIDPRRTQRDTSIDGRLGPDGKPQDKQKPLDSPSVYMGGNAKAKGAADKEMDAGLSWDRVYSTNGEPTWTADPKGWTKPPSGDVYVNDHGTWKQLTLDQDGNETSARKDVPPDTIRQLNLQPNCAFRPYIRTDQWHTPKFSQGAGTATSDKPDNQYFYPGERVHMSFTVDPKKDPAQASTVRLKISCEGRKHGDFEMTQPAKGWPGDTRSFKRVNAVDTHGGINGIPVPTNTRATGAVWEDVKIVRSGGRPAESLDPSRSKQVRDIQTSHLYYEHHYQDHGTEKVKRSAVPIDGTDVGRGPQYKFTDVFKVHCGDPSDKSSEQIDITPPIPAWGRTIDSDITEPPSSPRPA